ncbi:MAG: hypothetical protein ACI9CA_001970 [Natronomonas sp.]|jgi:hypothetical protein
MAEQRALYGGLLLVVGAVPLILSYGFHPVGYLGAGLALFGLLVSYGAWYVGT